ncbi:MAG TPA: (2Fe-2S) ferredoxin domain-containing protein, partial [Candidatus Glassbacteria bacterium]|nr:(2Fe-2S) ferredoxin domain-containing protein [Candidatus Glassbacteria bacterium]
MKQLIEIKELILQDSPPAPNGDKVLLVSNATCGRAHGSSALVEAFRESWEKNNLYADARLRVTGCLGYCDKEPIVIVRPQGFFYPHPSPGDVEDIINESVIGGRPVERL